MRKPKYPGELLEKESKKKLMKRKKHLISPLTGLKEGSKKDVAMDKKIASKLAKPDSKHKKMPHLKPKGAKGKTQVKKLGRTFKTGGFNKIAKEAGKEYGSKEAGKKVAGAIFQKMVKARKGKHKSAGKAC